MNVAVCEDDRMDSEAICGCIRDYCEKNCYVSDIRAFDSGEALLAAFAPGAFDVIVMDIYLPGASGVQTAQKIRETDPNCALVIVTVSTEHTREGYAVQAVSYIEKPIAQEKIDKAFSMCRHVFEKNSRLIKAPVGRAGYVDIPLARVEYVEVNDKHTLFHISGNTLKTSLTLDEAGRLLGGEPFLCCHRSYIVNLNYVTDMLVNDFMLKSGERVPIRMNGRKEINIAFAQFMTRGPFVSGLS